MYPIKTTQKAQSQVLQTLIQGWATSFRCPILRHPMMNRQ